MSRPPVDPHIEQYMHDLIPERSAVLEEMEQLAAEKKFPIVGPLVGQFLQLIAMARGAKTVFEMGSGFGYSTLWFASAVGETGMVTHTDGDPDNTARAKQYVSREGLSERVHFLTGDARELLAADPDTYDIVFCDIDKYQYPGVVELAIEHLAPRGLLIFDNALWFGKVLDPPPADRDTAGVIAMTRAIYEHPDLHTSIVPLRDGLLVAFRKPVDRW